MAHGYKKGGLKPDKYHIVKGDSSPRDPAAIYFVLRVDKDPHARRALALYADSVREDNSQLSDDLIALLHKTAQKGDV